MDKYKASKMYVSYILPDKNLLKIKNKSESEEWIQRFIKWNNKHKIFLEEQSKDAYGRDRPTHERLIKARNSVIKLIRENTIFTYLDEKLSKEIKVPSTTNLIEGGIDSRLREMLRMHRGLRLERRIKAVFWWCYEHSPNPLSATEILKVMPTDKSISQIYNRMNERNNLEGSIQKWGDAIVWGDLHKDSFSNNIWD